MKTWNPNCPVSGCRKKRLQGDLMCGGDWGLVPSDLQQQIKIEARACYGSPAHKALARQAVDAVLDRLGITKSMVGGRTRDWRV